MIGSACGESLSGENGNQRSDYVNPSSQSAVRSRLIASCAEGIYDVLVSDLGCYQVRG